MASDDWGNEVGQILHQQTQDTASQLRNNFAAAQGTNPDKEATVRRAAAVTGLPLPTARNLPDVAQAQAALAGFDAHTLAQRFPNTAQFLTDGANMRLVHDDIPATARVEQQIQQAPAAFVGPPEQSMWDRLWSAGTWGDAVKYVFSANPGNDNLMSDVAAAARGLSGAIGSTLFRAAGGLALPIDAALGGTTLQDAAFGQAYRYAQSADLANSGAAQGFGNKLTRSVTSLGLQLPMMMATGGAAEAPAAAQGVQTLGQYLIGSLRHATAAMAVPALTDASETARKVFDATGDNVAAARAGLAQYLSSTATGVMPMSAPGGLATRLASGGASGIATGEVSREAMNLVLPEQMQHGFNWEDLLLSGVTGSLLGGFGPRSQASGLADLMAQRHLDSLRAVEAQRAGSVLEGVLQAADASKLRERDPLTFRALVDQAGQDGPVSDVWIDAKTLDATLAQSGVTRADLERTMPDVARQMDDAIATGGDVRIGLGDFATHIAGSGLEGKLLQEARVRPDAMNLRESQEFAQHSGDLMQRQAEALGGQQADLDARAADRDAVQAQIKAQLDATGRFRPEVNDTYAALMASFYDAQAQRMGVKATELAARYPVRIGAENPAGDALAQETRPEAATAVDTGKRSPITGKPIFDVLDAAGNKIESTFSANSADEAILNYRERPARQAAARAAAPAPTYYLPEPVKDKGSNWRQVRGQKFSDLDEDDGYLYHVTAAPTAGAVRKEGLVPNAGGMFGGFYANYSAGKVFVTERSGVSYWIDKVEQQLAHQMDRPPAVVVMRIPKDKVQVPLQEDTIGSGDAGARAYFATQALKQGQRGYFDPESKTIGLLKGADLSTFVHESGHFFLDAHADMAARIEASMREGASTGEGEQQMLHDMGVLLDWFGVKGTPEQSALDQWHSMSLEEQRQHHEQFARGWEAYALEGKAPSLELRQVFQRFRSWLLNVYRKLSNLNVTLTPEVRGVMDRMLASDDAIRTAEIARQYEPLFKNPDEAQRFAVDWQGYQRTAEQATADAVDTLQARGIRDMAWLGREHDKALKALEKRAAEARKAVEREVTAEVYQQPVYQAWQWLTARGEPDQRAQAERKGKAAGLDVGTDSLLPAIAKLGGLSRDAAANLLGVHPDDFKVQSGVFGKPIFRKTGGLSADAMGERLMEAGYLLPDEHGKFDLRALEEAIGDELRGKPRYSIAKEYGEKPPDLPGEHVIAGKLQTEALKEMFGSGPDAPWRKLSTLRMTSDRNGLHPDMVAEMFGFGSGRDLAEALIGAEHPKTVIDGMTDQRMLERHGDISSPEALQRAAEEAVHNEARLRFIATESMALDKATRVRQVVGANRRGGAVTVDMLARAAQQVADDTIARLKVRDLVASRFTAAETRAAKAAADALKSGDLPAAAEAKRSQMLNNRLAKTAMDTADEIAAGLKFFRRFDKASARDAVGAEYAAQIDALLDRYDLRKSTPLDAAARRQSLLEWVQEQQAKGLDPAVPQKLLDEAQRLPYKEMTVEDFRGLVDAVKSIEHLGKLKNKLLDLKEQRDLDALVAEAVDAMSKLPQRDAPEPRNPGVGGKPLDRMNAKFLNGASLLRSMDASLLKMEQLFDWLDSKNPNGVFNRVIFRRIAEAQGVEHEILKDITGKLKALGDAMPKEQRRDMLERYTVPELPDSRTGKPSSLLKKEILAIALNTGNESNLRKLVEGEGWQERDVWAALNRHMTKADWDFVQGVWNAVESLWPRIEAQEKRINGVAPEKIVPRPISTPHGDYAGGYYPVVYDPLRAHDVDVRNEKAGDKLFENSYTRPATSKGHTMARVDYARPLLLSLDVLPRHVNQVAHDLAYREAIIDADKLLGDSRIRGAIEGTLGREYYKQLRPWLQAIANDKTYDERGLAFWDQMAHTARTSATLVGLGFRATTMLIHGATAASNSVGEIGVRWMASGIKGFLGSPEKMAQARDFVFERSAEMRNRMNEVDRDVRDALREMDLRAQTGAAGAVGHTADAVRRFAYYGISMLDMASAMPTWLGAYNKALHEGRSEDLAIYEADKAVRNAHGGGGIKDQAAFQRGSETQKLFGMFYSFWNHFYNRQRDIARTAAGLPELLRQGDYQGARRDFAMVLARSWFYFIIPQLLHAALKPPPPGQSEEEVHWATWAAEEIGLGMFSGIPVARDLANAAFTGRDYQPTPAVAAVAAAARLGKDVKNVATGQAPSDKWLKHAVETSGYVFGLPTGQASSSIQFLWDVAHGRQSPQDLKDWYRGLVHGDMNRH